MIKKDIIKDQKETIHRLQKECMEKTDIIEKLERENSTIEYMLHLAEQENKKMKKSFVSHSEFMDIFVNNPDINWEETAKQNIYLINKYKQALEEIRESCNDYAKTEDFVICNTFNEFLENIFIKINEVLK